jgi:hypothetical protein
MGDPLLLVDYAFKAIAKVVELLQQATEVDGHCRELLPVVKSMAPLLKQIERELRGSAGPVPDAVPEALKVRPVPAPYVSLWLGRTADWRGPRLLSHMISHGHVQRLQGALERAHADLSPIAKLAAKTTFGSRVKLVTRASAPPRTPRHPRCVSHCGVV